MPIEFFFRSGGNDGFRENRIVYRYRAVENLFFATATFGKVRIRLPSQPIIAPWGT